jgi:SAM-dependent methyltransferase
MPPLAYRQWVGPTEPERYDNSDRALVYPDFEAASYESVFDFGCGCGRVARQLILQNPQPSRYVGVDVHPELITWCRENLSPAAPGFEFYHHDVFDKLVNADEAKPDVLALPVEDGSVTFFESLSIFTHIVERQLAFYLTEAARVLRPDGVMNASFLLFEKADFPVLGAGRNSLYIDDAYPPAAVYYDRDWLQQTLADAGLVVTRVAQAPETRGYQWRLALSRARSGLVGIALPRDRGERGVPRDVRQRTEPEPRLTSGRTAPAARRSHTISPWTPARS